MNAEPTVLFEKLVSLFLMVAILVLIGLGTFYFKRRVMYLESAVKDQAQITQNILGMLNTMLKTNDEPFPKPSPSPSFKPPPSQAPLPSALSSSQAPRNGAFGSFGVGVDVAVIDLGAMLASEYPMDPAPRKRNSSEELEMPSNIVEIEADPLPSPSTTASYPSNLNSQGRGRIVVSDSDNDEANGASDIDADESPDRTEPNRTEPEEAGGTPGASAACEAGGGDDIGLSIVTTQEKTAGAAAAMMDAVGACGDHAYERLKVSELRDLLEKRGYADRVGSKYKQMKKPELVAALHSLDAAEKGEKCDAARQPHERDPGAHEVVTDTNTVGAGQGEVAVLEAN